MTTPRAIAVVADRDHEAATPTLTTLGWSDALAMLRAVPMVVAIAHTPARIRKRAPLLIGVPDRANIDAALRLVFTHLAGECVWYIACNDDTRDTVRNLVRLDEAPRGHA